MPERKPKKKSAVEKDELQQVRASLRALKEPMSKKVTVAALAERVEHLENVLRGKIKGLA